MEGFIPISRRIFDSPFWREEREYSRAEAWLDLIQRSRFEAGVQVVKNSVIELKRGEQIASLRYLGKRWKWDKGRVGRFIALLEKMGQLRHHMTQGQSVLTLCNYDKYNYSKRGVKTLSETVCETPVIQGRDGGETKDNKGKKEKRREQENGQGMALSGFLDESRGSERESERVPNRVRVSHPTLAEAKRHGVNLPVPCEERCVELWWNENEAAGWIDARGREIVKWQPALNAYISRWNNNLRNQPAPMLASSKPMVNKL